MTAKRRTPLYQRQRCLNIGLLIDVTQFAQKASIYNPTAITRTLWQNYIVATDDLKRYGETTMDRLRTVLLMYHLAASTSKKGSLIYFDVNFRMMTAESFVPKDVMVKLKASCRNIGTSMPVITITKA